MTHDYMGMIWIKLQRKIPFREISSFFTFNGDNTAIFSVTN